MDAAVIDASATLRGPVAPPVAPPHRIAPHRGQPLCAGISIREFGMDRGDYRRCFDAKTGDTPPGYTIRFTKPTGLTSADPAEFHVRAAECPWSVSVPGGSVAVVDARTASAAFVYENMSCKTRGCRRGDQCVFCYIGERALVKRTTSRANSEMKVHPAMGRNDLKTRDELVSSGAAWRTRQSAENQSSTQLLSQEFARRTAAAELAFMTERDRSDKEHAEKLYTAGGETSLASDLPPELKDTDANLVDKMSKCLAENKLTDKHFMYKLIESQLDSALAPDVRGIRWDPAIVDWATTMYKYGGEAIINLMNGNGGVGVGSATGGERDVGEFIFIFALYDQLRGRSVSFCHILWAIRLTSFFFNREDKLGRTLARDHQAEHPQNDGRVWDQPRVCPRRPGNVRESRFPAGRHDLDRRDAGYSLSSAERAARTNPGNGGT